MRSVPTLAALFGLALTPATALSQPKAPAKVTSVCPGKVLPLAVGNTWTYESVQARDSKGQPVPPREDMVKLRPLLATKIVVTVTGAETKDQETTVKLKETISYDITKDPKTPKLFDQVVESTIVCSTKGKFDISPESFFFAGEPGGFRGIKFSKFERKKETTLKLVNNTIGEAEWIEEIAAEYQREPFKGSGAKLGGGKLEMERKFTPLAPEGVQTRTTLYKIAEKLRLRTSGRISLDKVLAPDGKPCSVKKIVEEKKPAEDKKPEDKKAEKPEDKKPADPKAGDKKPEDEVVKKVIDVPTETCGLPADWDADLWLVNDVGLVQTLHMPWGHMYQLVDAKLN
jgi:hypothetical protein